TWESAARSFIDTLEQGLPLSPLLAEPRPARNGAEAGTNRSGSGSGGKPTQMRPGVSTARVGKGESHGSPYSVTEMVEAGGLTAFYPSREYYPVYRAASSIDTYVLTAQRSVVM